MYFCRLKDLRQGFSGDYYLICEETGSWHYVMSKEEYDDKIESINYDYD